MIFTIIYWWVWYLIEDIKFWLLLEVTSASSIPHVLCFRVLFSSLHRAQPLYWTRSPFNFDEPSPKSSCIIPYWIWFQSIKHVGHVWNGKDFHEEEVLVAEYWSVYPNAYMSACRWVAFTDIFQILVPAWPRSDGPIFPTHIYSNMITLKWAATGKYI